MLHQCWSGSHWSRLKAWILKQLDALRCVVQRKSIVKKKGGGLSAYPQFDCTILMLGMQRIFHAATVENSRNQTQNFSHRIKISSGAELQLAASSRSARLQTHTHTHRSSAINDSTNNNSNDKHSHPDTKPLPVQRRTTV